MPGIPSKQSIVLIGQLGSGVEILNQRQKSVKRRSDLAWDLFEQIGNGLFSATTFYRRWIVFAGFLQTREERL
jgi:hypothetical protein